MYYKSKVEKSIHQQLILFRDFIKFLKIIGIILSIWTCFLRRYEEPLWGYCPRLIYHIVRGC